MMINATKRLHTLQPDNQHRIVKLASENSRKTNIKFSAFLLISTLLYGCTGSVPVPEASSSPQSASTSEAPSEVNFSDAELHDVLSRLEARKKPIKLNADNPPPLNANGSAPSARDSLYNLLSLLHIKREPQPEAAVQLAGLYARLLVVNKNEIGSATKAQGDQDCEKIRCYPKEQLSWFKRWASSKEISRMLSVKVKLQNPDMATTTTLAAASYNSAGKNKGETWETEVNGTLYLTPYFRIDSNTIVNIEASLNAAIGSQSKVSRQLLAVVKGAAELAAPGSSLLTTITSSQLSQVSQFTDQALSSLFSGELTEKAANDFSLVYSFQQPVGGNSVVLATITGRFPDTKKLINENVNNIGTWEIRLAAPVASIFSTEPVNSATPDTQQLKNIFSSLTSAQVLNFSINQDLNLKQVLMTDNTIRAAIDQFNKQSTSADIARTVCVQIDQKAQAIGLNQFDAAALVWAFSYDAMFSTAQGQLIRSQHNNCSAAKWIRDINIGNINP